MEQNGKSFFNLYANEPKNANVEENKPNIKEKWNSTSENYSITIPKNSYKINGYTFTHWKDNRENIYYPDEELSVSVSNSPTFYDLYAVWEKVDIIVEKKKISLIKVSLLFW